MQRLNSRLLVNQYQFLEVFLLGEQKNSNAKAERNNQILLGDFFGKLSPKQNLFLTLDENNSIKILMLIRLLTVVDNIFNHPLNTWKNRNSKC